MSGEEHGFWLSLPVFKDCSSLSDFLVERLSAGHQADLVLLFDQQNIYVDGVSVRMLSRQEGLKVGQNVSVYFPDHQEGNVDLNWEILWENDELMAVFKPHLLPVSRTTRNLYNTLISLIRRQTPYSHAHLLHRLDTETAGVMLVAKNSVVDRKWKPQLDKLMCKKIYHAWVQGQPEWDELLFECELSEKIGSTIRSQIYVVDSQTPELFPKPKISKTAFKVLRREARGTLIECELFTGRKHQIRAQLAHLGIPVIGDKIYAHGGFYYLKRLDRVLTSADLAVLASPHHLLEAVSLKLQGDIWIDSPCKLSIE